MKKPKKHKVKSSEKSKQPSNIPPSPPPPSQGLIPHHRSTLFRAIRWIIVVAIGLVSLISGIDQILGPIWPTEPNFSPGYPSNSSPFNVPFSVANKSAVFSIKNLMISCVLINIETKTRPHAIHNVLVSIIPQNIIIKRMASKSYTCPYDRLLTTNEAIVSAQIQFISGYDSMLPYGGRVNTTSQIFTLNSSTIPPQWTEGIPVD